MKIVIEGDFYDCQLYKDRLFLWDTWGNVLVADIRSDIYQSQRKYDHRMEYIYAGKSIERLVLGGARMKGGIYPMDSAFMGQHLYIANETGLYRRYIQEGKRLNDFWKGRSFKLFDAQIVSLDVSADRLMAMGSKDGVFEMYVQSQTAITKWRKPVEDKADGIYQVNRKQSKNVQYVDENILSTGDDGSLTMLVFHNKYAKGKDLVVRRNLERAENADVPALQEKRLMLTWEGYKSIPHLKETNEERWYVNRHFTIGEAIPLAGKPRRGMNARFGFVVETRKEEMIELSSGEIFRIPGPITKSRVLSGFGGKNNLLCVVLKDRVEITDFYKELTKKKTNK